MRTCVLIVLLLIVASRDAAAQDDGRPNVRLMPYVGMAVHTGSGLAAPFEAPVVGGALLSTMRRFEWSIVDGQLLKCCGESYQLLAGTAMNVRLTGTRSDDGTFAGLGLAYSYLSSKGSEPAAVATLGTGAWSRRGTRFSIRLQQSLQAENRRHVTLIVGYRL